MHTRSLFTLLTMTFAVLVASASAPALAAGNPFERGPAPTVASIEAARGPFAFSQTTVPASSVHGFGGGTIYYPTTTSQGTFGAVAVSPGYTVLQNTIAWYGPRLASQGFVVITIDTLSKQDQPDARGIELLAALDYLVQTSSVRTRIDPNRLGVMGHSMGGGGTLRASANRPTLQAAIALTPYHPNRSWPNNKVPTMVVGADHDASAPVAQNALPIYQGLTSAPDKAYLELRNATHSAPQSPNVTIAKYSISWLKRFIDNDTRYEQFLCPPPKPSSLILEYRDTCPST